MKEERENSWAEAGLMVLVAVEGALSGGKKIGGGIGREVRRGVVA